MLLRITIEVCAFKMWSGKSDFHAEVTVVFETESQKMLVQVGV